MSIDRQTQMMLAAMGDGVYLASEVAKMAKLPRAAAVQCLILAEKAGYVERCGKIRPPHQNTRRKVSLWHKLERAQEIKIPKPVSSDGFTTDDDLAWMHYWRQPRATRRRLAWETS